MEYPTLEQVAEATHFRLAQWSRHLPGPGESAIGKDNFEEIMQQEMEVLDAIRARFEACGGWNPALSKGVGWDKPLTGA